MGMPSRTSPTPRSGGRLTPKDNLIRVATAMATSLVRPGGAENSLGKLYPGDEVSPALLHIVERAAVSGATTTGVGWAAELAQSAVADFVTHLGPVSAGSELLRAGLVVPQEQGEHGTTVPALTASASAASFVAEIQPIPVVRLTTSTITLSPKKIASLVVFSREMARRSSFEEIMRAALTESVALSLDSALFSNAAASTSTPAGLRYGVTPIAPSTGSGDAAMMIDLGALAGAIAPIGGSQIAYVAAPGEAVKISLKAGGRFAYPVFSSSALASGTVLAVALNALASAIDATPELAVSNAATLHMSDAPLAIGTAGTPTTVSAPTQSLYQADCLALRIILGVSWGVRAAGSVAVVENVAW